MQTTRSDCSTETMLSQASQLPHWIEFPPGISVDLEFTPHVDLVEIILAHPHRQWLQAVLDEAAALVQREGGVVASGDGQLNQCEVRMFTRLGERRLHQLTAQASVLVRPVHVHTEQGHLVPGFLTRLERQAD